MVLWGGGFNTGTVVGGLQVLFFGLACGFGSLASQLEVRVFVSFADFWGL